MTIEEPQTAELIAAIQGLDARAPAERERAAETVFRYVLVRARKAVHARRFPEEVGAEVVDDVVFRLSSNGPLRNVVLNAKDPKQYVERLVLHALVDQCRKRWWREEFEELEVFRESAIEDSSNLLDLVEATDMVAYVWSAISAEERDLLRMRFWEGMSIREVAQRLGLSSVITARRLSRIQGKLRRILVGGDAASPGSEALEPVATGVPSRERWPEWEPGKKPRKTPPGGQHSAAARSRGEVGAERFRRLAAAWREARGPTSSLTEMAMRPEYQQIIGMGRDAVPLVLEELQKEPDHWFWALAAMTGEDPVPSEHKGKLSEMTKDWLQWGRQHGYLQADDA